ncbi:MAG: YdcF family protein [Deltaproteobacteria bacterium]|nr:YdcF family protein [Deltaproteobacteria bacterium]
MTRPRSGRTSAFGARGRRVVAVVAALVALVCAASLACNVVVVRGGRAMPAPIEGAEVIVVLGAGIGPDGSVSQVLGDRLETALALYRAGRAPRLLLTGDHSSAEYDEVAAMRRWLEQRGVPRDALLLDGAGVDTFSSISRARTVYGVGRAIVVTQAFHLPRAVWLARAMGIDADGVAADLRPYRGAVWFELREVISRTKAWLDVSIGRTPRRLDPIAARALPLVPPVRLARDRYA